jgi:hypothetical protein
MLSSNSFILQSNPRADQQSKQAQSGAGLTRQGNRATTPSCSKPRAASIDSYHDQFSIDVLVLILWKRALEELPGSSGTGI